MNSVDRLKAPVRMGSAPIRRPSMLMGSLSPSAPIVCAHQSRRPSGAHQCAHQRRRPSTFFLGEMLVSLECSLSSLPSGRPVWLMGSRRPSTGSKGAHQGAHRLDLMGSRRPSIGSNGLAPINLTHGANHCVSKLCSSRCLMLHVLSPALRHYRAHSLLGFGLPPRRLRRASGEVVSP